MGFGDVCQFQLALLAHAEHCLDLWLPQREQPRRFHILDGVDLDRHASKLLLPAVLILLILLIALRECICEDGLVGVPRGVRDLEDLLGTLPELVYLALDAHFLDGVLDLFDVYHALIGEGVE